MRAGWCLLSLASLASIAPLPAQATAPQPATAGSGTVGSGTAGSGTAARELAWHELAHPDQALTVEEMIGEIDHFGEAAGPVRDDARTVPGLDGVTVTLTGYLVPIATDSRRGIVELFLVPYYGACIHVPPPPANQIVHIRPDRPLAAGEPWDAYRVTGRLRVAKTANETATAAYAMDLLHIEAMPDSASGRYRWLGDAIVIAVFLALLFATQAISRSPHR